MSKTVICTGASAGIGLATVTALLAAGYNVVGVDISTQPPSISSSSYEHCQIDLTKPYAAATVISVALKSFDGELHGLINVAGIMDSMQAVDCFDDEQWDRCMAVNLTAPTKLMREFVKALRDKKASGAIVNVASKAALSGAAAGVAYTASKAGLVGATKSVAFAFASEGIRCNAVCPGAVPNTNIGATFNQQLMDVRNYQKVMAFTGLAQPEHLHLEPQQVASLLVYLVSDASSGMNGAIVPIDNGWSTY